MARACPNWHCRQEQEDETKQCPNCGAQMNRAPDLPPDYNGHLYSLQANAGTPHYQGGQGQMRQGAEPVYADTIAVKEVAYGLIMEDMNAG